MRAQNTSDLTLNCTIGVLGFFLASTKSIKTGTTEYKIQLLNKAPLIDFFFPLPFTYLQEYDFLGQFQKWLMELSLGYVGVLTQEYFREGEKLWSIDKSIITVLYIRDQKVFLYQKKKKK